VLIVASKNDPAASNVARELVRAKNFRKFSEGSELFRSGDVYLKYIESDSIYTDRLDIDLKPNAVIFASRHRSESGEPALTVHWTGNSTSRADFGGKPKSLSFADPPRLRAALLALDREREERKLNYAVTLEATHHGPSELGVPTLFVEVGSTQREWDDAQAAGVAAEAIWRAATEPVQGKVAVGFGGGHYCNKQCVCLRKDGYAFGHILSKYFFDEFDPAVVRMAFERTLQKPRIAVVDWKGIRGPQRAKLLETLNEMNAEIVRV